MSKVASVKTGTSASATRRCFVAETKGGRCGYLTLMSGIASGAERVYLPEEGLRIADTRLYGNKDSRRASAGRQTREVLLSVLHERDGQATAGREEFG